jgi:hypothetical protein
MAGVTDASRAEREWVHRMTEAGLNQLRRQGASEEELAAPRTALEKLFTLAYKGRGRECPRFRWRWTAV